MSANRTRKSPAQQNIILLPQRTKRSFYGHGIPNVELDKLTGKLIVVEGADGSGRSTQLARLVEWLERGGHATDFADRYERQILPLLRAGYLVLADRYIFTALARDAVRGVDRDWVEQLYSFAVHPDITFYFRVPLETSLGRILDGRPALKYHEAGLDMGWSTDPYESFRIFQGKVFAEYESMREKFNFTAVDATEEIHIQQAKVRALIREKIDLPSYRRRPCQ